MHYSESSSRRLPRVLIVEDSRTEILQMVSLLQTNMFEVLIAEDGDDGLQAARRERPDCIVLDVVLPKQSGFQVCRKLKHEEATKNIPIIFVTGKATPLDRQWAMKQGASHYIVKPFAHTDLLTKIRECLVQQPRQS